MGLHRHLIAVVAVFLAAASAMAGPKWLVTPFEARVVGTSTDTVKEPVAAVAGPGPAIVVRHPKLLERVISPLDIFVEFRPGESGLDVNMKTLAVTLIGFVDFDITDRVREYIRGTNLEVEQAELPTGTHRLRLAIKDVDGNPNERDMVVHVVK